jgi:hypothetical protein
MLMEESLIGEMCHIHGQRSGAARYREDLAPDELHSVDNLVLLCPIHHKLVDDDDKTYTPDWLRRIKSEHEARAANTSAPLVSRLIQMLAPDVPEEWQDRPGAPVLRLSLASSRPQNGSWTFEISLNQIDGGAIGRLEARYRHGDIETPWIKREMRTSSQWRLDNYTLQPFGWPFELQLRFWWDGASRAIIYRWKVEDHFQTRAVEISYM